MNCASIASAWPRPSVSSASKFSAIAIRAHASYAENLGLAFQLTNIIRDVSEDAARGRIYLPLEDLARFGVTEDELLHGAL